jgi:L-ascorbate metabolism protein UlaG (beta-lactamase superfamily)
MSLIAVGRRALHRVLAVSATVLLTACASAPACGPGWRASPQFDADGCRFRNAANPAAQPSQSGWSIWSRFVFGTKDGTVPVDAIPVRPLTQAQLQALPDDANHIVRLGHSSHLLKLQGRYWLIDPVFGERVSPFSFFGPKRFHAPPLALHELPPIEAVLLSHDHYDHLDAPTIAHLRDTVQRYFVPLGVGERLREMGVAAERITEFDWWQDAEHAQVRLTATPSQHFSGRGLTDRDRTLWASWMLQAGGQTIFFSGDSGYFGGFRQIGARFANIDIALIENGAYDPWWPSVHLSPRESVQAFEDLRAKTLYSVHNSTFDLAFHRWQAPMAELAALAQARGIDLATPEIGEVLTVGAARQNRLWWEGLR